MIKIIFLPSEKGSTQKGKNLLPNGANSFLLEQTPFREGLAFSKVNRKSQKSLLAKAMENLLLITVTDCLGNYSYYLHIYYY